MDVEKLIWRIERQKNFQSSRDDSDESFTTPYVEALEWALQLAIELEAAEIEEDNRLEALLEQGEEYD